MYDDDDSTPATRALGCLRCWAAWAMFYGGWDGNSNAPPLRTLPAAQRAMVAAVLSDAGAGVLAGVG